jgi:hypothetical protein
MDTVAAGRRRIRLAFSGAAAIVLAFALVAGLTGDIESDLSSRSRDALEAAGVDVMQVEFDGRDAVLRGVTGEDRQRIAVEVVSSVRGVRSVRIEEIGSQADVLGRTGGIATCGT